MSRANGCDANVLASFVASDRVDKNVVHISPFVLGQMAFTPYAQIYSQAFEAKRVTYPIGDI